LRASLELFQRALAKDSTFALAYAGLADTYWSLVDDWLAPEEFYPRGEGCDAARARAGFDAG
jgi:hypothetical protein